MPPSLSAEDFTKFKAQLKRRYLELWDDVRREVVKTDAEPYSNLAGEVHDLEDEATADVLVDVNLAEIHRDIGEMRDITAALDRITDHSYGTCADCGGEIGLDRLHVYPTAKRCRPCQQRYEKTHVRTSGPTL
jgi:RNA polymerase-binding protein DksA